MEDLVLPVSRPVVGALGRTGLWRSLRPVVDAAKCTGCLQCWLYCPEGVIEVEDRRPRVDYEYCKGCGVCAEVCPAGAIKMVREGEGNGG